MSRLRTVFVLMSVAIFAVACGVPTDDSPRAIPADRVPFDLLAPATTTSTTTPVQTAPVDVFMMKDNRLSSVRRVVAAPATVGASLATLIQGPSEAEARTGLTSLVNAQSGVMGAQVTNGAAVVNISDAFKAITRDDQIRALAQIVYTATAIADVQSVQFQVNSGIVDVFNGDGTLTRQPLTRADYSRLAP